MAGEKKAGRRITRRHSRDQLVYGTRDLCLGRREEHGGTGSVQSCRRLLAGRLLLRRPSARCVWERPGSIAQKLQTRGRKEPGCENLLRSVRSTVVAQHSRWESSVAAMTGWTPRSRSRRSSGSRCRGGRCAALPRRSIRKHRGLHGGGGGGGGGGIANSSPLFHVLSRKTYGQGRGNVVTRQRRRWCRADRAGHVVLHGRGDAWRGAEKVGCAREENGGREGGKGRRKEVAFFAAKGGSRVKCAGSWAGVERT